MNNAYLAAAAALAVLAIPRPQLRNQQKLPSFRGVCEVRASLPGRLRVYMPAIGENPSQAEAMGAQLLSTGAISEVQINPRIGTALFVYDPNQVEGAVVMGAAIRLMGLEAAVGKRPMSSMERELRLLWDAVDHGVLEATGGLMDGKVLAGSALTIAGLRSLAVDGPAGPGALTLLWWAMSLFRRGNHD